MNTLSCLPAAAGYQTFWVCHVQWIIACERVRLPRHTHQGIDAQELVSRRIVVAANYLRGDEGPTGANDRLASQATPNGTRAQRCGPRLHAEALFPQHSALSGSGQQGERCDVARPHHAEVPMIKGSDFGGVDSLGDGDHRGVDHPEGKVGVGRYQCRNAEKVVRGDWFELQLAVGQLCQETPFGRGSRERS